MLVHNYCVDLEQYRSDVVHLLHRTCLSAECWVYIHDWQRTWAASHSCFEPPDAEAHGRPFNVEVKAAGLFTPSDDSSNSFCSWAGDAVVLMHRACLSSDMHEGRLLRALNIVT